MTAPPPSTTEVVMMLVEDLRDEIEVAPTVLAATLAALVKERDQLLIDLAAAEVVRDRYVAEEKHERELRQSTERELAEARRMLGATSIGDVR